MLVKTIWRGWKLAVQLAQVHPLKLIDGIMQVAVADWHYWIARGYDQISTIAKNDLFPSGLIPGEMISQGKNRHQQFAKC